MDCKNIDRVIIIVLALLVVCDALLLYCEISRQNSTNRSDKIAAAKLNTIKSDLEELQSTLKTITTPN